MTHKTTNPFFRVDEDVWARKGKTSLFEIIRIMDVEIPCEDNPETTSEGYRIEHYEIHAPFLEAAIEETHHSHDYEIVGEFVLSEEINEKLFEEFGIRRELLLYQYCLQTNNQKDFSISVLSYSRREANVLFTEEVSNNWTHPFLTNSSVRNSDGTINLHQAQVIIKSGEKATVVNSPF